MYMVAMVTWFHYFHGMSTCITLVMDRKRELRLQGAQHLHIMAQQTSPSEEIKSSMVNEQATLRRGSVIIKIPCKTKDTRAIL